MRNPYVLVAFPDVFIFETEGKLAEFLRGEYAADNIWNIVWGIVYEDGINDEDADSIPELPKHRTNYKNFLIQMRKLDDKGIINVLRITTVSSEFRMICADYPVLLMEDVQM